MKLNQRAKYITDTLLDLSAELKITAGFSENEAQLIDLGLESTGSLEAGRLLAEVCLSGLNACFLQRCF